MNTTWLVLLIGVLATTQNHLAKALERQGIEVFDMLQARWQKSDRQFEQPRRKPLIYLVGVAMNHTIFVYHLLVAPLGGNTAAYTSMYGLGMVALLLYSTRVMKEPITRLELTGALAILGGSLVIGAESVSRPALEMSAMNLSATLAALLGLLCLGALLMFISLRSASPHLIGVCFGLVAGSLGAMDPFMKAVGQTAGGASGTPLTFGGWFVFLASFLVGEAAFLTSQWAFIKRARANILVPAQNCSYIALPVLLQALWMPGYQLYLSTLLGLFLIMVGIIIMGVFKGALPHLIQQARV
jgi:multidrug transporter EmrE-like cation transporter